MSIRVMSRVWDEGPRKQGALLVMLALADYSNDAGECWPSVRSIAEKARMTERGVQRIVRQLEDEGWLEVDTGNGRHGCNRYLINPDRRATPDRMSPRPSIPETPTVDPETPTLGTPEPSRTINEPSVEDNTDSKLDCSQKQKDDDPPKERLPEGWVPSDADVAHALSKNLTQAEIEEIANDFHDYWRDQPRVKRSARGWSATWRQNIARVGAQYIRNRSMAGKQGPRGFGQGGSIASAVARRRSGG